MDSSSYFLVVRERKKVPWRLKGPKSHGLLCSISPNMIFAFSTILVYDVGCVYSQWRVALVQGAIKTIKFRDDHHLRVLVVYFLPAWQSRDTMLGGIEIVSGMF